MVIIEKINDLKKNIREYKKQGKNIGFVPTMGYLHEGHISLVREAKKQNDIVIMSIFVNPIQFGPKEDFSKYPRDLEKDSELALEAGVDIIFYPEASEMYGEDFNTFINVSGVTEMLCGKSRPGHFQGVATVVAKLFNIVEPDKAYFGQKDAQQVIVISKMVKDLNMNLEIVICPIIREKDGLAMSSRNVFLSPEHRKSALVLSRSLFKAKALIESGETDREKVYKGIVSMISSEAEANIDYVEIVSAETLAPIVELKGRILIALAVKFGTTRLIDNVIAESIK